METTYRVRFLVEDGDAVMAGEGECPQSQVDALRAQWAEDHPGEDLALSDAELAREWVAVSTLVRLGKVGADWTAEVSQVVVDWPVPEAGDLYREALDALARGEAHALSPDRLSDADSREHYRRLAEAAAAPRVSGGCGNLRAPAFDGYL